MKLSIIVPVYNMVAGNKLKYCMDSLLKQRMIDYEVIAVDDKSTDNSLEVLLEYEKKHGDIIRVIASPENRRQGGAKNLGLEAATGEWVGFVDSDDWVAEDMFSKLLKKAEETDADVVGCGYLITDTQGKNTGISVSNNTEKQTGELGEEQYKEIILHPGSMVVKIYKRDIFEKNKIRFPEGMFYEDNAIGVFPLLYAKRFERVDEDLYYYFQHAASTVHSVDMDKCEDRVKAEEIYLTECRRRGFYEKYKQEIDYKVFELGYRNTLFSYLQAESYPSYKYVVKMQKYLKSVLPDYAKNPYYEKYMDAENKKLIGMHEKNALTFLIYYQLLHLYRKIRYGNR